MPHAVPTGGGETPERLPPAAWMPAQGARAGVPRGPMDASRWPVAHAEWCACVQDAEVTEEDPIFMMEPIDEIRVGLGDDSPAQIKNLLKGDNHWIIQDAVGFPAGGCHWMSCCFALRGRASRSVSASTTAIRM